MILTNDSNILEICKIDEEYMTEKKKKGFS